MQGIDRRIDAMNYVKALGKLERTIRSLPWNGHLCPGEIQEAWAGAWNVLATSLTAASTIPVYPQASGKHFIW